MKFFVIFPILVISLGFSIADSQYQGNIEYYHMPIIVESKQYSILAQSIIGKFTGVLYDTQADSLIFSIHGSTDSIDSASISMNKQTFLDLLFTDYAKTPDSMLVLINGVEQPYKTVEDDEIISWRFHVPSDSSEIEIIPSTPMFSTGTYSMEDIPFGPPMIYPPLKQNHVGIVAEDIQCKENLVLVQKNDGSPACVKTESKEKLMERGWTNLNTDKFRHAVSLPSPPDPMSITITGNDKLPLFTIKRGETKEIDFLLEPKIPIISATVAVGSYFGSAGNCNNISSDSYCPGRGIMMNLTDTKITSKKEVTLTISIPENMAVGTYGYQIETKTTFDMPSVEKTRTVGNSLRFDIQVK